MIEIPYKISINPLSRYVVLAVGLMVALGNFFPNWPTWGFDHYVLGLPFGFKSIASFLLIMIIATFPFLHGRSVLYDWLYTFIAVFACSFLFLSSYYAFRNMLTGLDMPQAYTAATGEKYQSDSIFFSLPSRLVVLALTCVYLFWSFRLSSLSWREIGLIAAAIVVSVFVTIRYTTGTL